jgi:hypothetical protein
MPKPKSDGSKFHRFGCFPPRRAWAGLNERAPMQDSGVLSGTSCFGLSYRADRSRFYINHTSEALFPSYCSFAYSALDSFRMGMSGSASFQRVRKSL